MHLKYPLSVIAVGSCAGLWGVLTTVEIDAFVPLGTLGALCLVGLRHGKSFARNRFGDREAYQRPLRGSGS